MTTDTASTADLARGVFDGFNAHDVDAMRRLWSDGVEERMPDGTYRGPGELAPYFKALFAALPDIHMDVKAIVAEGDEAFVRWTLTGTHEGEFQGIKPTGRRMEIEGVDHLTFRDGRLVSNFVIFDRQQFAQQLGLMPPDGSGAERGLKAAFNAQTALKARLAKRR